jgi:hypothetical protein
MLRARPAIESDIWWISEELRQEDVDEIYAASGLGPWPAVQICVEHTPEPMVGVDEKDDPVCIGGVAPTGDPMVGAVWALCTQYVEFHKVSFLRRSIPWVHLWQSQYPILTNCVDERNELHIKWLRWLGFTFIRRHPQWGYEKRPFLEFVRIDSCVKS